ncbi:Zn(II)2Cys6 transcription factor [Aspergillus melleus]|uniref:Zn(II)2Cys6 transcription factor n=1 Tax=Aspergillus melleus TaxID=138277 RepID=UPI001E8CB580|nr:uncharacterized protein LDX57_010136 [Aspergillus melleus]KAH8432500.1 hypothetical protein LDX57_010136 [Aspergillus melleus]
MAANNNNTHPNRQEIDRVLGLKRKQQREQKACYPCRQRKVKCDSTQPCKTCRRRGHPEICAYDVEESNTRANHPAQGRFNSPPDLNTWASGDAVTPQSIMLSGPPTPRQSGSQLQPPDQAASASLHRNSSMDGPENEYIYSGDNSIVSIVRNRTHDASGSIAHEVGSVLGLQNTYGSYPFMDPKTPEERWQELVRIIPQRTEVLKFFHFYRLSAYPFNPILVDIERFEIDLCTYLNAYASGEFRDSSQISDKWATDRSIGHISLLLATLAAGAHYSDLEHPQRTEICHDFARRSFQALRLANFLFRPSMDIIQTMLIVGNTLQNNGQSEAAWALLGTTVRLAQTLGLHTEKSTARLPGYIQVKARKLWFTIVWQDSLLCLCYDRPPVVSIAGWTPDNSIFNRLDLSFTEIMHYVCRIALGITTSEVRDAQEVTRALEMLNSLDAVFQRAQPHLRNRGDCRTLHHNLEHLALKMHLSLAGSVLSRPALKSSQVREEAWYDILRTRAKTSLIDASKAFLEFQALSIVPLRSWSMVHTVLSSTLLLCIWEETRNDAECRDLQQRVIEVFSAAGSVGSVGNAASQNGQWLSERHIRALITLRNAVGNALDQSREQGHPSENPPYLEALFPENQFFPVFPEGYGTLDQTGVSPISYLDSIMNVPLFDFSQENGFL